MNALQESRLLSPVKGERGGGLRLVWSKSQLFLKHFGGRLSLGEGLATKSDELLEKIPNSLRPPQPSFLENYIAIFL